MTTGSDRARPQSEESEIFMPGDMGAMREELRRLGRELKEGMQELRQDLKDGMKELRDNHDARQQEIVDIRLRLAQLPSPEEFEALKKQVNALDKAEALTSQKVALYVGAALGLITFGWKIIEALAHFAQK